MSVSLSVGVGMLPTVADVAQLVERELPKLRRWWSVDQRRADQTVSPPKIPAGGSEIAARRKSGFPTQHGAFVGDAE